MKKVKVIRSEYNLSSYDDYHSTNILFPATEDWDEVTDVECEEIREAIRYANMSQRNGQYFLVEYSDTTVADVFKSAKAFRDKMEKDRKKEEKAREDAKRKRDEKALERKRKQLEKLKKELGAS
jgi:hypothetical protein